MLLGVTLAMLLGSRPARAGSLKDIDHVVIFMQENRSWNNVCAVHVLDVLPQDY